MINQTTQPKFSFYLDTRNPLKEKVNGKIVFPLKFRATFQVIKNGKKDWDKKLISLNHYCTEKEFDKGNNETHAIKMVAQNKADNILKSHTVITPDQFVKKFINGTAGDLKTVHSMFNVIIQELENENRIGSVDVYLSTRNSLIKYAYPELIDVIKKEERDLRKGKIKEKTTNCPLSFMEITPAWIRQYFSSFDNKTTPSIYLRQLRAVFNRAIDDEIIKEDLYPFSRGKGKRDSKKKVTIKKSKGSKRALDATDKNRLLNILEHPDVKKLGDEEIKKLRWSVDMWRFSYYCSGLNMFDIARLKFKNIGKDSIVTQRHKIINTDPDNEVIVPMCSEIDEIVLRHRNKTLNPNDYVFPILKPGLTAHQIKWRVKHFTMDVNAGLLEIEKILKLDIHLTTYTARHTFANIILRKGGTKEFIKDALGHAIQATTDEYCHPFDLETKRKMQSLL
jgi:integrase/recombinase XerD